MIMAVVIKKDNETCDAKCYDAAGDVCKCACGGKNHGKGLEKAIENTKEMVDKGELDCVQLTFDMNRILPPNLGTVFYTGEIKGMEYRVPYNDYVAKCDVEVFIEVEGRCIVLITERQDNPGMSITNAMEHVIEQLMGMKRTRDHLNLPEYLVPKTASEIIFVEHYPPEFSFGETYDIVNYNSHMKPSWKRITRDQWGELVKDWVKK